MADFGRLLAGLGWYWHFVILAVALALIWGLLRFIPRLRPYTGQLLVLFAIFWMGLLFYLISYSFPRGFLTGPVGAWTIPRVWFFALIPVSILTLIQIVRGKDDPDPKWGNVRLVAIILATLIITSGVIPYIGYYISSVIFIVITMWMLGSRSKIELIAVPVGWVLFSYFIFAELLGVRLPIGSIIYSILN